MTFSYSPYWAQSQSDSKDNHEYNSPLPPMPFFTYNDGYISPVSDNEDARVAFHGLPVLTIHINGYQTPNTYPTSAFEPCEFSPVFSDDYMTPYTSCLSSPGLHHEPWIEASPSTVCKEDFLQRHSNHRTQSMARSDLPGGSQHVDPRKLIARPGNINAVVKSIGRSALTPATLRANGIQKSKAPEKVISARTQETSWWCGECHKSFTRSTNLRAHLERHNPHRVQSNCCHLCNKSFSRPGDRTRHIRSVHNRELHSCKECNSAFPRRDILQRHQKIGCSKRKQYHKRNSKKKAAPQ